MSESITETEALTSVLERNRSIAEVTSAVAHEMQTGESLATASSAAVSFGLGSGSALQADGRPLGIPMSETATSGMSLGLSAGTSRGWSWASSEGTRDIRAEMTQQINDTTHQASNLTRNRWATAVREVSQSEYEQLSTRTVANYNHMHALTIQYYEVVQLYRTVVELARVTRCLFIPMKLVDFRQPSVVARYRRVIGAAGLNARVRALLVAEPDSLVVAAPQRAEPWSDFVLRVGRAFVGEDIGTPTSPALFYPLEGLRFRFSILDFADRDAPFLSAIFESRDGMTREVNFRQRGETDVDPAGGLRIFDTDLFPIPQNGDVQAIGEAYRRASEAFLRFSRVILRKRQGQENFAGRIDISMGLSLVESQPRQPGPDTDVPFMRISARIDVPADGTTVVAFDLAHTLGSQELVDHLQGNQLYYSQAVWRSLDAAMLAVLLSPYTFGGRPLFQSIDPVPVAVAGNYLVFRTYAEDPSWATFLREKGLQTGRVSETIVPLPSGGVFAEAVLGRSNSAEKLDITRFWNWQDSPIPLQAPEIAALQAGSRAQPDDLTPGQLGAPVLNIVNPPALPDPQGMAAVLAAIQNGNMFRDMSGLAATIGLTQAALEQGFQGARDAAAQAGQNAATAATLLSNLYRQSANGRAPSTVSKEGAMINQGRSMDQRGVGDQITRPPVEGAGGDPGTYVASADDSSYETDAFNTARPATADEIIGAIVPAIWPGSPRGEPAAPETVTEAEAIEREFVIARQTLRQSSRVADSFTVYGLNAQGQFGRVPAESEFWFAKIYEIITYEELAAVNEGRQFPAFMLNFIPVFYDLYYQPLQRHLFRRPGVPSHWQVHFDIVDVEIDSSSLATYLDQIVQCIVSGVRAHIQGDMATALDRAYRAYRAKYPNITPDFDELLPDFFERDPVVFERVPARFFTYLSRLTLPFLSADVGQYLFGAGNELIRGLPISDIVSWRADAWRTALTALQQ